MLEYHPVPSTHLPLLNVLVVPLALDLGCYFAKSRRDLAGSTHERSSAKNAVIFTR
jgi:hypothetical protein